MRAADIYEIIIKEFATSAFHEQAYVSLIDVDMLLGDFVNAQKYAKEFIKKYPRSQFRGQIKEKITIIGPKAREQARMQASKPIADKQAESVKENLTFEPGKQLTSADLQLLLSPDSQKKQEFGSVFTVQVGAFSSKENANSLADKLRGKGNTVFVSQAVSKDNKSVFKVRVGSFKTKAEAAAAAATLSKEGLPTKVLP
jgi:septal ring-binding cell division protein DamX